MARSSIKWKGQPENRDFLPFIADGTSITFDATQPGGSAMVGLAVTCSADQTISTAADGEAVVGLLVRVEADLKCNVQVRGMIPFKKGTAATLTHGKKIVGDLLVAAEGYVREVATGTAAELGVARGWIGDASDADIVYVYME